MIKLQDFARESGVTDRQIQRLLKKYEDQLTGLFERKGSNGTWLTDDACEILRRKMKQLPPAVIDGQTFRENDELKKRIRELEERLTQKEMLVEMAQRRADELQEKAGKVYLLEESKKLLEAKIEAAEEAKVEYKEQATQATQEAAAATQALRDTQDKLLEAEKEKEAVKAEFEAYKKLPFWKKLRG